MRDQIAFTTHGFGTETSDRDVCKLSASNLMIVWDELEQYLNSTTEPNFKKIIDNNPQKIIDKYQVLPMVVKPIAIYGATSNMRQFKLGQEGSRRMFHIPVKWVDTDILLEINWHKIINDLKIKVSKLLKRGIVPWLLEEEELEQQIHLHKSLRAKNAIDITLAEVFDTSKDLTGRSIIPGVKTLQRNTNFRALTTKEVADLLIRYGFPPHKMHRPTLIRALERLCGNYTVTRRKTKMFETPACRVYKGLAVQSNKRKWIMPPMYDYVWESISSSFSNLGGM